MVWTVSIIALIVVLTSVILRVAFHGDRLAQMVTASLNERIRGTVSIGSIEWPTSALTKVVTGGWIELTVRDLEVYDEDGELVVKTDLATAELDAHAAIFGRHDLILRNIKAVNGGYAKVKQVAEPYPAHEFDYYAVSLISAFYPKTDPSFRAGLKARPGVVIDLRDYEVAGVTMEFEIRDLFYAIVYGIHGRGDLRFDGSDPLAKKLYYTLTPKAPLGLIRLPGGGTEVLTDIDVKRLALVPTQFPREVFPRDLEYEATAIGTNGAKLHIDGAMLDHWVDFFGGEHKARVVVEDAKLSSQLIASQVLGPEADSSIAADHIAVDLTGPVLAPRVAVELIDVDYVQRMTGRPTLELQLATANASFDMATEAGNLENTVARGLGGEVKLEADFTLRPLAFHAKLDIAKPLDLSPYLTADVKRIAGSQLSGQLEAIGTPQIQRLERLDLRLGRAHVAGKAYRTKSGTIAAEGLRATLDRTTAKDIRGWVNTTDKNIDVRFNLASRDLGSLLARLGYARFADGVDGFVHIGGPLDDIRVKGRLGFRGVPVVDNLQARLSYRRELLRIDRAHSATLGGVITARGAIDVSGRPRFKSLAIGGKDLELAKIPGMEGKLTGTASLEARATGPVDRPEADLELGLSGLSVGGDRYKDTVIRASASGGGYSLTGDIERARGGRLQVDARVTPGGGLGGDINLASLPLGDILRAAGVESEIAGGTLSSKIALSGTVDEPTGDGVIRATKSWLAEAFLGSTDIEIKRIDAGVLQIAGRLLQGRVAIDGTVSTVAPFETDVEVRFRRLEADHFFPELAARYGARAWVSGRVNYRADLLPSSKRRPTASARLTEVEVRIDREDDQGRPAPLRVRSSQPIELSYNGNTLALNTPAVFTGPGGSLSVSGEMNDAGVDLAVSGTIALSLLERYTESQFDAIAGKVHIEAKAVGPLPVPEIAGTLVFRDVAVRPAGQDTFVTVPVGKIEVTNSQITATGLSVVVVDDYSDETATLDISGAVKLRDFVPADWTVFIDGELAGKMLLVAAPATFSSAGGRAALSLTLSGTGVYPEVSGELTFSEQNSLTFTPRGLRREIRLTGGQLAFDDEEILFDAVTGWVDDEGQFTIGPESENADERSVLNHRSLRPSSIDLTLDARNLPFRVPQVLALSVNLDQVRIVGDFSPDLPIGDRLSIGGAVEIVDGRYIQNWTNLLQNQFKPQRISESAPPIWERVPLLGNARLSLDVASPGFAVANNIAKINLNGGVAVTGTPLRPKVQGIVDVEQGSFKIPGFRANFTRTTGSVTFSRVREFPTTTPNLDITSESNYRDLRGQDHLVTLRLTGPLENISWDLSTAGGLNRAQTLTLIVFGRTPADARRLFGDEPVGRRDPGDLGSGVSTVDSDSTLAAVDRLAKDLVGDQFNLLIGDKLRDLTKLDVLRVEVGTASWGLRAEKELTESLRLLGDAAWSLRGFSGTFSLENRFNDTVSIDFNGLAKRFNDEALDDENDLTIRFSWRKVLLP